MIIAKCKLQIAAEEFLNSFGLLHFALVILPCSDVPVSDSLACSDLGLLSPASSIGHGNRAKRGRLGHWSFLSDL